MKEPETDVSLIRRAARRGASSVTRSRQREADAVAYAVERWEDAVMRGKHVSHWGAWAFRVAANAARRPPARRREHTPSSSKKADSANFADAALAAFDAQDPIDEPQDSVHEVACCRRLVRAHLAQRKNLLRGRQLEVLRKMAEPGMSFHLAAKELGMDRKSVRRSFHSGMARVAGH